MKYQIRAVSGVVLAAMLLVSGCSGAAVTTSPTPTAELSGSEDAAARWRPLREGSLVGFIHQYWIPTSFDDDEQLLLDLLTERGFEVDGHRDLGQLEFLPETIDQWVDDGAAAIVIESTRWEELAGNIARAREAGVRIISYIETPPQSVEVDVHVGVRAGAIERAQLESLIGVLESGQTEKPWEIAHVVQPEETGLQHDEQVMISAVESLVTDGVLGSSDEIDLQRYEMGKSGRNWEKGVQKWFGQHPNLAGVAFAQSAPLDMLLQDSGLFSAEVPIAACQDKSCEGINYETYRTLRENPHYSVVIALPDDLVDGVGVALDALQTDAIDALPRLGYGDVPGDIPMVVVEPVTVTRDNYRTVLQHTEDLFSEIGPIMEEEQW